MNSFLSATMIKEYAEIFADTSDQSNEASPLQSVLFIIDICDMTKETTPFGFIQNYSCNPDEEEVLFSISAIFKVRSVKQHENKWHVHLQLSKQQNELCQGLSRYMMKEIGPEPGPLSFGWFLYRMNDFNQATRYAEFMLKELLPNDKGIGDAYNLLGLIYKDSNSLPQAIECYKKALETYSHSNLDDISRAIINTHINLGLAYLKLDDIPLAEEQRNYAEETLRSSLFRNDLLLVAMIDNLTAKIQTAHGNYNDAFKIFKSVLKQKKKRLPSDHPSIGTTLNDMGIVYEKLGNNRKAHDYFNRALEIRKKCLPPDHIDFAECHTNIGRILEKTRLPTLASKQYKLASNLMMNGIRKGTN
jgi:tetratricopeptide (TPR) repeat protein